MKRRVLFGVIALGMSLPRPSGACLPPLRNGGAHHLDPEFVGDTVAPGAVQATFGIERYEGVGGGCGDEVNECGDGVFQLVNLDVSAEDDQAPEDRLGYRLTIVGGQPPPRLSLPGQDVLALGGEHIGLTYDAEHRGAFSFDLEIRAVDLNGNIGPATVLTISDPG